MTVRELIKLLEHMPMGATVVADTSWEYGSYFRSPVDRVVEGEKGDVVIECEDEID